MLGVNVALTERLSDMKTTQEGAVTVHAPLHPANEKPGEGSAVRVATCARGNVEKFCVQSLGQSIPGPVTFPADARRHG